MNFRFRFGGQGNTASSATVTIDLVQEFSFPGGKVVQAFFYRHPQQPQLRQLVYREARTGQWRTTEGLSFGDRPRTPENLIAVLGLGEAEKVIFLKPEA